MLHYKDQVFSAITEVNLWLCFLLRGQQGTTFWHIIVV